LRYGKRKLRLFFSGLCPDPPKASPLDSVTNAFFQKAFREINIAYHILGFQPFSATCAAKTEQNRRFWFIADFAAKNAKHFQAKAESLLEMPAFQMLSSGSDDMCVRTDENRQVFVHCRLCRPEMPQAF